MLGDIWITLTAKYDLIIERLKFFQGVQVLIFQFICQTELLLHVFSCWMDLNFYFRHLKNVYSNILYGLWVVVSMKKVFDQVLDQTRWHKISFSFCIIIPFVKLITLTLLNNTFYRWCRKMKISNKILYGKFVID